MSERRNRRRLHARARALGVPVDSVPRRGTPKQRTGRPLAAPSWDAPRWQDTESPDRDLPALRDEPAGLPGHYDPHERDDREVVEPRRTRTASCCEVVLTRRVMDGGTIVMLSTHSAHCPIWSPQR